MAARIRTLNFLPEVFQTPTNAQFLGATLDQIVDQPNTMKIEGYVGSKFGYGINAKDKYVIEPTKTRTNYQLDPGVVFTKTNTSTAQDFISYPGIIDALNLENGITNNNDRLFNSQFYSWDPFVNLDKIINFNQYYWLPTGAPSVNITTDIVYSATDYVVESLPNGYNISSDVDPAGATNPTLTLIRGGTYTFTVNQSTEFWIQGKPGITGFDPQQTNLQTRDVFGVENNGATTGVVVFTVPYKDAQSEYNFPGNNLVDVVSTTPFDQINGQLLSTVGNIDGVTALNGLTVMFYNTGVVNETGFVSKFYDTTLYDQNDPALTDNFGDYEGGVYTDVSATFYTITFEGDMSDPVLRLTPASEIPTNQKITATYGTEWKARNFYRNVSGTINLIPYLSSLLDTLYYQDGTSANKVGVIKLINSNSTNQIDVTDILGKEQYTSPNGVVFTNGLKVNFSGDIFPASYKTGEYYVEGVGTAIELINTTDLITPESFTGGTYTPYDSLPYDIGNYDSTLYIPVLQDYITIARNSIDKNAWSRSNRWFHIDVINATATYNNDPTIATTYATQDNKAKRPIIEFYPNLRLFDNGVVGKDPIDFFDDRTTDAFTYVAGQKQYWPDVEVYTAYTGAIAAATGTTTTITVLANDVTGTFQVGQYISDTTNVLPRNTQITQIDSNTVDNVTTLTLTVSWVGSTTIASTTTSSLVANDVSNDNYSLYDGARIVFAADTNENVRNKIYVVRFSNVQGTPVITLTEAENGLVLPLECTFAFKGYNYQGMDFFFDGVNWKNAQQKQTVNQPPLFDIFDNDGISFGNTDVYVGSSFAGTKLFSYGIGSGIKDIVLGFPLRYSAVNNVGDISFDVPLNSDTFNYVQGQTPITQQINTGYVYNYTSSTSVVRQLGWQTAVAPSRQYQIFSFDYIAAQTTSQYICDVAAANDTVWPNIQVFVNNEIQPSSSYTATITETTTVIDFYVPNLNVDTIVEVAILSNQVSKSAYYQVPINLQNNPFNEDVTVVNVGDIRGQYQSIFYNNPNTTGQVFGANNYRDLGNLVPWGNKIIQNSASLVLPGALLRQQNHNLFNSIQYNSQQYITFKSLLINTIDNTAYNVYQTPAVILDDALDQITQNKTTSEPFFWSDMLPNKAAYVTNTYTFANSLDVSIYPLTRIYNFDTANYYGVLVYLTTTVNNFTSTSQLIINQDYTVSTTSPSLTITKDLSPGDIVTIKEYTQTFGSYVPNTPTKLGLYPSFIPEVVLDSTYSQPTYFIVGHDGSYTKLYGEYINGHLVDFRDQALLEFETRIYNNLKLSDIVPISEYDVIPGFFRTTDYSYDEILQIYSKYFLNWIGQNRIEYKKQFYQANDEFSYNYSQSGNKINGQAFEQGFWRGIYEYFYDTSTPNTTPWEMLGFSDQPSWWTNRYGPAPYTSDNLVLWGDLAQGINWNNGNPVVIPNAVREGLLTVIPVDSQGNLLSPFDAVMGNYNQRTFRNDWKVGDVGPAEFAYRRSSTWPYDLMQIIALTKPAQFFNLGFDVDNYKYNTEFNQYLVNNRSHLVISDVAIYGNGTPKTSYVNWIVDYEKQIGVDATTNLTTLFDNLDVRLVYRLAGFSDKALLNFFVEKGTPNSKNASLLIPDESYSILLYDNIPITTVIYSGVVVQITSTGWKVFGNSQDTAYFTVSVPKINGNYNKVTVGNLTVQLAKDYVTDVTATVPYGTEFATLQEVSQFLASYGEYLLTQGVLFDQIESGLDVNWRQMTSELLYWAQSGWEVGSIINLNPAANLITINKDSHVVQPLTLQKQNFILNQNFYPIQSVDLAVTRDSTFFSARPLNEGDTVAYGQFNISNFEHGVVFNNVTLFNDIIYNLVTGLRQTRILTRGTKSADWNGTIDAQGFILNQDNIQEWSPNVKYTRGSIVKYKNKYWFALKVLNAQATFDEQSWKETDYNEIQKGLLPNSSTRSYESTLFYNTNKSNLDKDSDLLSWSLIGYRPRDYMALADLTDITQVNVYKNLIKEKGTRIAAENFKGITLPQGGIDYDIYDNWAIKTGEFGGVLNDNFVDFKLNQTELTGNPSIVGLTDGVYTDGVQQEVPVYSVFNYGRPISGPNVLPTVPTDTPNKVFPDAGYVNFNDVKISSYYYNGLNTAVTPLSKLYVNEYVWLADYLSTWQVYTPSSIGQVISVTNNLNGTATVRFNVPHNLSKYQPFAIINFNDAVDGYRLVTSVVDTFSVTITLALSPSVVTLTGSGVGMRFSSQRVDKPSDINNLPLLDSEFVKNKVWVDENNDGSWAVYRKSLNYVYADELLKSSSITYGSAVAQTPNLGYLVTDAGAGTAYRYTYSPVFDTYNIVQTITEGTSFGSNIIHIDDTFVISQPTGATYSDRKVYIYDLVITTLLNELQEVQVIESPNDDSVSNWGSSVAMSGDKNWLYISAYEQNLVYVYRKSAITGEYEFMETITVAGLASGDNFGYAISTNYYGNNLVVSAPNKDGIVNDYGYTYTFERLTQNFEVPYNSLPYTPQVFGLIFTPGTVSREATDTSEPAHTNEIKVTGGLSGVSVDDPVVFSGTTLLSPGPISANTVYYVKSISGSRFTISATRGGSEIALDTDSGSMTVTFQTEPIFVGVNGTLIDDNQYAVIGSNINLYNTLTAGDIVNVSGSEFILTQTLSSSIPGFAEVGTVFGYSLDTDTYGNEILVGAPFEINNNNQEGAVYRYTNSGGSYGLIVGTSTCNVTVATTILLNGYSVQIPAGDATTVANAINSANITNVNASATNGILTIQVISIDLAYANTKLSLSVLDASVLTQLGINIYTQTQIINDPHSQGRTQFGSNIKFNQNGSFVVSAPVSARYAETTFDASDDENYDNDTLFDNNTTQFIDTFVNAGAVYMYDYLPVYNETVTNSGAYVYAQSVNALNIDYGAQPHYGTALDFNNDSVMIGTPNFRPSFDNGQVVIYNNTSGLPDWSVYRQSAPVVDVDAIQNVQLYSVSTNNTLDNLDYIDPLQGKLLGAVRENIDIVSNADPANYNGPNAVNTGSTSWGPTEVGKLWFDTSTTRFVNYHQNNDVVYNSQWWGRVFPGSDVKVYSWVTSNVSPIEYAGSGTPRSVEDYSVEYVLNSTGSLVPVYFFWVRNTNIVFNQIGKTLSDTICESYIATPLATGISYMAPIQPNVFGLYNCGSNINANDTALHIGFSTGTNDDVSHSVYSLIRSNYADDFLPGLPGVGSAVVPESLYNRMLESFSGVDQTGAVVPDPFLPKPVQSGILVRPRQSFFYNRFKGLENYLTTANKIFALYPLAETSSLKFLFTEGEINPSTIDNPSWPGLPLRFFNTQDYWELTNWWAVGYDNNTKSSMLVESYYDLATINAQLGLIVTVNKNSAGLQETYIFNGTAWERIGLQNGTIQFKSSLWDYETARLGFGDNFFDTTPYDTFPSEETRYIIRALNEELPTELLIYRNQLLILMFQYIVSETVESQNYLPWLNKTSFIDVAHTIRELLPLEVFQSDNQDFLAGYLNEVKPYHVVIKDFLFKYTGTDVYAGEITDFDLPAQYNTQYQQYITPELVYANPSGINQFLPTDPIWQTQPYINWFNNQGLSITGVNEYPITVLSSYIALNSNTIVVDNVYGFPINGVITVGEEQIAYSGVDRAYSSLTGLTRGVNGTPIKNHIPGEQIIINLPPVLVLDGGRGYAEPPKVIAYIDETLYPAPRRAAILKPVMNLDSILRIDVVDPGDGYQVLPEIIIDPSAVITFASTEVDIATQTIVVENQFIQTGDLVKYNVGENTTPVGGLLVGQYYYAAVLETIPFFVVALYTSYADALQDRDRVVFTSTGLGTNNTLAISARASCVSSAVPVRENQITLRFDRTTYDSQVTEWAPNNFYGSFYAGLFNNSTQIASSSIQLESTQPPISSILASSQGATFEIQDVTNDQVLTWSSLLRTVSAVTALTNVITLQYSSTEPNASGSTIGFYVGMPVKFTGALSGTNIENGTTYYVNSIVDEANFTISETAGGSIFDITGTIGDAGVTCYTGEFTNTAIVTIAYPGILNVTATAQTSNFITTPTLPSGTAGTQGFYVGLPVYFVGNVFGGIIENDPYYIITVIDDETFTISKTANPLILEVTNTTDSGDLVTVNSTLQLSVNDPIVFTGITFGGIIAGQVYYIRSIESGTTITIASILNGGAVPLTTDSGSCSLTSQTTAVQLSTATGSMTMNVGLPVSPGQVTGQQFTFYQTDPSVATGVSGTNGNLIAVTTVATTDNGDYLYISSLSGGTTNMYINMPFQLTDTIGGLSASTTYQVGNVGTIETTVTGTSSSNILTCDSTVGFYVDMPINFTGAVFGNVVDLVTYYILTVDTINNQFTISSTPGGSEVDLYDDNGAMTLLGNNPYITVQGETLSYETKEVSFNQYPTAVPTFNVSTKLGGYIVEIVDAGEGYTFDNTVTISGTLLGGTSPANDLTVTVSGIDAIVPNPEYEFLLPLESDGTITSAIVSGTPANVVNQYYLKVISATECKVYSDPLMLIPVSGIDFQYAWKDYAFLPEPFYFNQSIVKYNNQVWQCVISNNDNEFILGKWELLDSGNRKLNELDRIVGYYKPNKNDTYAWNQYINMPGDDLTQLVNGITYPNSTYKGNAFAPEDSFTVDTILEDQTFYPTSVNTTGIVWDGATYVASMNTPDYSATILSADASSWEINKIVDIPVNASDIDYLAGVFVLSCNNATNPIYTSDDGITFATATVESTSISSAAYGGNVWVAVGDNIVNSQDTITWTQTYNFSNGLTNTLSDVKHVTIPSYSGFVAVGTAQDNSTGNVQNVSAVITSVDGSYWTQLPSVSFNGFNAVTASATRLIAVGEDGVIYTSLNGANWSGVNETNIISTNPITNVVNVGSTTGFQVGDTVRFTNSFDVISAGTSYSISNIVSATQVELDSVTVNGSNPSSTTFMYLYPRGETLNDVVYDNSLFMAVGNNGTIKTSTDGYTWVAKTSGTTEQLNGVTYNTDTSEWIIVGNNNTIIVSTDNGDTWTTSALFNTQPVVYDVQGDPFLSGYGPEELVPGIVTDNLTMIVNTRPGTDWLATEYANVGYNAVSTEITPTFGQTEFSFKLIVENPASMSLFDVDTTTNTSTRIYNYSVDWVNKVITLDTALAEQHNLAINLYEVGNGDQLVKSNSQSIPFVDNITTGFVEMPLNCNYSASRFSGSGVMRPNSVPKQVIATETDALDNGIVCENVDNFALNTSITFQGDVFGGINTNTVYFVKTVSTITNKITVSLSLVGGVAGPTVTVTSDTGSMLVNIQAENGQVWSDPIVIHNGTNLVLGEQGIITQTISGTNEIVVNTTDNYLVNDTIVFSNAIETGSFAGCGLSAQTTYYITSTTFNTITVSETQGGSDVALVDAVGIALCVTNDYAITIADAGITAKIVFANQYNQNNDFVVLSVFGETYPQQYGYTLPETQLITADGTVGPFSLTNYVSGSNPTNAIVEVNGLRVNPSTYTIDSSTNEITFDSATTDGNTIAVTSYNLTDRQYLHTQTDNTQIVANIIAINNNITAPLATSTIIATTASTDLISGNTSNFIPDAPIIFKTVSGGTALSNIVPGQVYYVVAGFSPTQFQISETQGGAVFDITSDDTGTMVAYVGGLEAVTLTTGIAHGLSTDDVIRIDGVSGSFELNNNTYYAKVITSTQVALYNAPYSTVISTVNDPVTNISSYSGGGYVWKDTIFTISTSEVSETTSGDNTIIVADTSEFVIGTPIIFTGEVFGGLQSTVTSDNFKIGSTYQIIETGNTDWVAMGALNGNSGTIFVATATGDTADTGTATAIYYVLSKAPAYLTITAVRNGDEYVLTPDTGTCNITQWQQTNVDRVWVTVNGYRIPSSGLYLNPQNNLSILTTIEVGDEVIITSMMPSSTPNEATYMQMVNKSGVQSVFRANSLTRTWLTHPLQNVDAVIYLEDVTKVTESLVQSEIAPAVIDNTMTIGLIGDKRIISQVIIYNNTTNQTISSEDYYITTNNIAPVVVVNINPDSPAITVGDNLTLTVILGNLIYINGEQIRFTTVDFENNTLSGLQRGANGTGEQTYIPKYTEVYSILSSNMLPEIYNNFSWNSFNYNLVDGDPLQISTTYPATFLNADVP